MLELLDGNYESAIKSLQRALETEPDSSSLLTDLGSAYFVRAESANRPIDYGSAIESFGKALAKSPDDPIALFNRALACERLYFYTQAVDDWQHYLRIDPQSDWSNDARARLAALPEKIKQHEKSEKEPLLKPKEIAQAGAGDSVLREKIDQRVEDYLNVAATDWLPNAYPTSGQEYADRESDARTSLAILADISRQKHGDHWLADLMASATSAKFALAVEYLSAAIKANDTGDSVAARNHAREAARLFASEQNDAGALRARVEHMFASQDAQDGLRLAVTLADRRLHSLHDDKSRIDWAEQSAGAYRDLVQQRLLEGDPEGALELWESFRGAELSAADSVPSGSPALSQLHEVASRLPSLTKETVVTYATLPKGFAVWVYDDRGIWSDWIQGNPKEIQSQVERFRALCSDFRSEQSDVERNARNLYGILFAPIEHRVPSDRLLVVDADDELAAIPFEALTDAQGHYLADRFSIVASRGIYYRADPRAVSSIGPDWRWFYLACLLCRGDLFRLGYDFIVSSILSF